MSCPYSKRGHRWIAVTFAIPRGEGHSDYAIDHAARICSKCRAEGRVDKMGRIQASDPTPGNSAQVNPGPDETKRQ